MDESIAQRVGKTNTKNIMLMRRIGYLTFAGESYRLADKL